MKKFISIMLSIILISLVACSTGTGTAKVEIIPEGTELSGILSISTDDIESDVSGIYTLIEGFTELHPNVNVELDLESGLDLYEIGEITYEELRLVYDSFDKKLKVNMLSGNTPDLLFLNLDYVSDFQSSGLLRDINEFVESDESFIKEDYFMDVLKAHEFEGKLYSMIPYFTVDFVRFREDVLAAAEVDIDSITSIDYKFLFDTYDKAMASGKVAELKYIDYEGLGAKSLLRQEAFAGSVENGVMNFLSENFIDYLNTTYNYTGASEGLGYWYYFAEQELLEGDEHFADRITATLKTIDLTRLIEEKENVSPAYPITTANEEVVLYNASYLSIPTSAKNPELAWEFVKYCIEESEEINTHWQYAGKHNGDRFDGFIPINKNNFEKYFAGWLEDYSEEDIEKIYDYIYSALEMPLVREIPNYNVWKEFYKIEEQFYDGFITAEECAAQMQERADVHIGENS